MTSSPSDVVRQAIEDAWNTPGNFRKWADYVGPGYVHHIFNGVTDIDGWLQGAAGLAAAFPVVRYELRTVLADGDEVAVHFTLTGTNTGPLGTLEPTGKTITTTGAYFCRVEAGKIVEDWEVWMAIPVVRQMVLVARG